MAKIREEIVGKRFLSVSNSCKLKLSKISQWDWRAGVIRACTHADIKHPELQILVEYEDVSWERREWIHVHKEQAFQVLLVEHTLVFAPRNCWPKLRGPSGLCPALIFDTLVDDVGLTETKERPVEYLVDRVLEFHDYDTVKNYQEEECSPLNEDCREAVRKWIAEQDGQRILCTTPSVLVGFRVQVYRSEGTTQWYTAVIVGYNENTRELTVTDDTVLEEHSENPSLVHIRLLGEGVVESILRGENVGITPRRSRSGVNNTHASGIRHHRRETVASLRGRKSSCPTSKVPTPLVSPLLSQSPPSPAQSTSPSSPRLPLTINALKSNNSSGDNPSDNQRVSSEEPIQTRDLHSFRTSGTSKFSVPTTIPSEPNKEEKSSNYSSVPSPSQEENLPPKHIICNPNPSNSPSSPTNPDKPTNPRKENSKPSSVSETESSTTKDNTPLKTNSESPLTLCSTESKDQIPTTPEVNDNQSPTVKSNQSLTVKSEQESYSLAKNTCLSNNSLKKVLIKVKNNLQLIDPLSFSDKDKEETVSKDSNNLTVSKDSNSLTVSKDSNSLTTFDTFVSKANLEEPKSNTSDFLVIDKYSVLKPLKVTKNENNSEKNLKAFDVQNSNSPNKIVDIRDLTSSKLTSDKCSFNNLKKSSEVCELNSSNSNSNKNSLNSNLPRVTESNDLKTPVVTSHSESKSGDVTPSFDSKSEESKQSDKYISNQNEEVQCNKPLLDIPLQTRNNDELNNNNSNSNSNNNSNNNNNNNDDGDDDQKKTSSEKELKETKEVSSKDCAELDKNASSPVNSKKEPVQLENNSSNHCGGLNQSVSKVLTENNNNNNNNNSLSDIKPFQVSPLSNGRVRRPLNSLVYHTNSPTSVPSDNKSSVPDFLKIKQNNNNNNNTYRKVILLSSEGLKVEGNNSDELLDKKNPTIPFPSIGLVKSTSDVSPLAVTLPSNVESNVDVASRLLNTDCTLSLSLVGDSSCNHRKSPLPNDDLSIVTVTPTTVTTSEDCATTNKVGVSSYSPPGSRVNSLHSSYNSGSVGGELAHSLAAAGAVSGRAVTITATSGPAPQGNSRVASPPSVSITAVVRSPNTAYNPHPPQPTHHNPSELTVHHHHHDGGSVQLHHPHPPQTHLGPLSTATRMDQGDGSSDSGVSVTERSVSRSSVLSDDRSSSAEVKPNTPTPTPVSVAAPLKSSLPALVVDRKESVKVWRNPAVLSQSELSVRHIHSLQHTAMSQHFPGVHPHIAPPNSAQAGNHPGSLPTTAHGLLPPPRSSLPHAIPPLHYPGHPGPPPLHLNPGLQPSLSAAAALYPQLQQDVWKQLQGHVGPLASNAYAASLLPRHQEELSYLEHQARELEKQQMVDRSQRERREAEAREKQAKEKMDRERVERRKERERRERDERERSRRADWSSEADLQLVNKHFEESFRYASQKLGRENLRQMPPSENHPASVYYSQGLTSQQTAPTHLTHPPSLLISQQPTSQSTSQSQQQTQNKNFQPHSQGSPWSQNIGNLSLKVDGRDHRQQPPPRHQPTSQPSNESIRKVKEPEQFVKESIYNAFRSTDDPNNDPQMKSHNPPPAHSKHPSDKSSPNLPGYPVPFSLKEHKPHGLDRSTYPIPPSHEKASVIVQPDLKYDKVAQHSVSPKQRPPERSSPYSAQPPAQGPNHYKPYEPTTPNRAPSAIHHSSSLSPSPHNVELTKARQPLSSPHAVQPSAASNERYYSSGTKPPVSSPYQLNLASGGLLQNHLHNINTMPVKSKVSSPPLQMYGKPGITSGAPVCKIDTRPNPQPLPLTSKAPTLNGPPPAHLGSRNHDARPPPTPHEQRVSHNRSPFDTRHYPGSGVSHPKTVTTSVVSTHPTPRIPPTSSPHVMSGHHSPHPPTQTQPLDLGTRDGSNSSPTARRRSLTPTPQETKRPRLDNVSPSPMLSRVSEPSPLYPTAATTITTVENTVAFAKLQRVSSPVVSNAQSSVVSSNITKSSSVITNSPSNSTFPSNSNTPETANSSVPVTVSRPSSQPPPSASPVALTNANRTETSSPPNSKQLEPEKCSSPGPAGSAGNVYVHKLKKAWLQRHTSGAEPSPSNHSNGSNNNSSGSNSNSSNGSTSASSCSISPAKSSSPIAASKPDSKTPLRKVKPLPGLPNGHGQEGKEMDSTSTDSDDSNSPKMKRMKTKRNLKRMKKGSESNSDSDKESDGSEESVKKAGNLPMKQDIEPRRRRGRKPKIKPEKEDLLKVKRSKDDTPNDPLQKPPVSQLKKTGESFLQDRSCYEVAPKLPKCRECRWTAQQRNKKMPNIFCRFYAFRRLRYTKNGQLAVAGFSDPVKDAYGEDLRLWVPDLAAPASDLDCEMSKFLLTHVGDQFCDLVQQENEAMALHMGEDPVVAWKRVVQGVREMCDVCETTLFNIHWACSKCGFVVCIDCYKGRKEGTVKVWDVDEGAKERDKYSWLLCASRVPHELDKLMLTQIIAGNALADLGNKIHEWRYKWGVPMYCGCSEASKYKEKEQEDKKLNGINKDLIKNIKKESKSDLVNGTVKLEKGERINGKDDDMSNSPLNFFADVALSNDKRESESSNSDSDSDSDGKDGQPSTLRELLTVRSSSKSSVIGKEDSSTTSKSKEPSKKKAKLDTLDDVISCVIERDVDKDNKKDPMKVELKHFIRKYNYNRKGKEPLPIRIMTKTESRLLYPNVPHSWLCDGKLLRLHDPLHKDNVTIFQDQWKRGQPVIVSGTGQNLDSDLWKPQSFAKDFGEAKNNLINCLTDNIVPNQPMKKFWEGFEHYGKRLKDEKGQPMVLKLKDWPPTDDFAEMLPRRFNDLMRILPMGEYTRRNGSLNLAGRLPECFVRPDLGPKMYIAYGSVSYPSKASTNLHLDISDAVNVMCYVGVPKDVEYEENMRETLKAIDDAGCDILTRQRVREKEEVPGALWHIYHARDADKIRDLLNKVAIERGKKLEPFHDPIHDQSWYLDGPLRERLYKEYAVEGYAIVQCMGDAVFIPAGAPHQVRNLQNCVKVAEDFVSPENISHCFHLTQEFRHLSDTHTNHEDKLQIKNIIYHAMKDAISSLMASEQRLESEIKKEGNS